MSDDLIFPTHYTEKEGGSLYPYPYLKDGIATWILDSMITSNQRAFVFKSEKTKTEIKIHSLMYLDSFKEIVWRWDCFNGTTHGAPGTKQNIKEKLMSISGICFPMPTEQGKCVKILDQTFYVVCAGAKPETVKLFGPFSPNKMSMRTVSWKKFLQERVRVI